MSATADEFMGDIVDALVASSDEAQSISGSQRGPSLVKLLSAFWPLKKLDEASASVRYDDGTVYLVTVTRYEQGEESE